MTEQAEQLTLETLAAAEAVAGLEFTQAEREMMLEGIQKRLDEFAKLRSVDIPNNIPPALFFNPRIADPSPGSSPNEQNALKGRVAVTEPRRDRAVGPLPTDHNDLAFAP